MKENGRMECSMANVKNKSFIVKNFWILTCGLIIK